MGGAPHAPGCAGTREAGPWCCQGALAHLEMGLAGGGRVGAQEQAREDQGLDLQRRRRALVLRRPGQGEARSGGGTVRGRQGQGEAGPGGGSVQPCIPPEAACSPAAAVLACSGARLPRPGGRGAGRAAAAHAAPPGLAAGGGRAHREGLLDARDDERRVPREAVGQHLHQRHQHREHAHLPAPAPAAGHPGGLTPSASPAWPGAREHAGWPQGRLLDQEPGASAAAPRLTARKGCKYCGRFAMILYEFAASCTTSACATLTELGMCRPAAPPEPHPRLEGLLTQLPVEGPEMQCPGAPLPPSPAS
jgi:hypothetical protein